MSAVDVHPEPVTGEQPGTAAAVAPDRLRAAGERDAAPAEWLGQEGDPLRADHLPTDSPQHRGHRRDRARLGTEPAGCHREARVADGEHGIPRPSAFANMTEKRPAYVDCAAHR